MQQSQAAVSASASRKTLAGFFVSGLLLSFPGAIFPAWGYHIREHYAAIGNYFLFINLGLLISVGFARELLVRRGVSFVLTLGCAVAAAALVALSLASPPASEWWRVPGFLLLGVGAGVLNTAVFHAISASYRQSPATTVNLAGTFFGAGSGLVVVLIALAFNIYTPGSILLLVSLIPAFFAVWFARMRFPAEPLAPERPMTDLLRDFTIPSAVLFSALLFCHFGNEWAIAGWLPLLLIQRLGISPTAAILFLATYWLALAAGRLITQLILPLVSHTRLLLGSILAAIFGCVILGFTDNRFGAGAGTILVGLGFAPVYPLVVEKIGARFPHYHPGFFNGIFSLALTGGMLAPATLGYAAQGYGVGAVIILPMIGTIVVFILLSLIWLESKLSGLGSASADKAGL